MARTRGCGLIKCWINTGGQVCLRTNHERALMCVITIMDARQIWHTWGDEDFSKKRSRHPFSSTFDPSLQLFFKISTQLERKFLQIANHEEQSCSILVPHTFPRLSVRSSTNSRSPLSVENFVSATLSPFSPVCCAAEHENENERSWKVKERERRGRKKKEEGTAHKYLCSPRCIDIIHGYRSSGGGNAFSLAAIRLSPRLEDADRFVQPVASPLTSTLRVLLHRFDERLPYPLGVASENWKKRKRPRGTEIDTRSAATILGSQCTGCLRNRGAEKRKERRNNTLWKIPTLLTLVVPFDSPFNFPRIDISFNWKKKKKEKRKFSLHISNTYRIRSFIINQDCYPLPHSNSLFFNAHVYTRRSTSRQPRLIDILSPTFVSNPIQGIKGSVEIIGKTGPFREKRNEAT